MKKRSIATGLYKQVAIVLIFSAGLSFSAEAFSKTRCDIARENLLYLMDKVTDAADICASLSILGSSCNGLQERYMRLLADAQKEFYACDRS